MISAVLVSLIILQRSGLSRMKGKDRGKEKKRSRREQVM